MHSAVLQNKKYIDFAERNSVEVLTVSAIETAVERKDPKASVYEETDAQGRKSSYFLEFPGLTLEDLTALNRSPANRYNQTGKIPYTSVVDPHTLEPIEGWLGGQSAKTIMETVTAARKELAKTHGEGIDRRDWKELQAAPDEIQAEIGKGDLKDAYKIVDKFGKKSENWPEAIRGRVEALRELVSDAVSEVVKRIESQAETDPAGAMREARKLVSELRGTEAAARAEALVATLENR